MDYNNYDRGYAEPSMNASDYMTRTYRWMASGLLITFAMAYITATTSLIYLVDSLYLVLTIAELALVFVLSSRVQNMSVDAARAMFFGYALLNGMVLSYYFIVFSVGTLVSLGSALALALALGLTREQYATLLPKSVTTPIAISVSQAHGGIGPITVVAVLITGIFGSIAAPLLIKLFRVKDPMTAGLAIGASSHAVGTSKALELGEVEGAMSSLSIAVAGLMTVIAVPLMAGLIG